MKTKNYIIFLTALVLIMIIGGCARLEKYGEAVSGKNSVSINDIFARPEAYNGKTVTIKGKIAIECETGCWFNFREGSEEIFVDIEPSGFAIPQKSGHNATVEGTVTIKDGRPVLIGKGVEIK